jgi:hypothetical protein
MNSIRKQTTVNLMYGTLKLTAGLAVIGLALVGCGGTPDETSSSMPVIGGGSMEGIKKTDLTADKLVGTLPGLPSNAKQVTDSDKIFRGEAMTVASRYGHARQDPFALKPGEKQYEIDQSTERITTSMGGWSGPMFQPKEEKNPNAGLTVEPQPYRRLSGVVVGDAVYAILETEGQETVLIRPGMKIPNSDWTVASIDQEKAVLVRTGNKLPRTVVVRLESPPANIGSGTTGNAPGSGSPQPGPGTMGPPGGGKSGGGTAGAG